ncbi:MAG TPA: S-layer homology domain-containing protein [Candidatus Butyricicoccus stercorigallinarum]|nr:S-layer homology domain-containing protein [Candidatus Butyricicoccus stercorigallinarum]
MKQRIGGFLLAAALLLGLLPARALAAQFTDIEGHWAQQSIERAVELGLFSGATETEFQPDKTMTRAMLVVVLAKMSGQQMPETVTTRFSDVSAGAWYAQAVTWAVDNGIVSGTSSTTFSPNRAVTREQAAVILVAYSNAAGYVLPRTRACAGFSDDARCADYALDAVYTIYRSGLVDGMPGGKFAPASALTRAQGAVILCAYLDLYASGYTDEQKVVLVNHRGYSATAPENTLPAYELSVQKGYTYVETDVQFTKDGEAVLLHDATINRTSNVEQVTGSSQKVYLSSSALSTVQQYDFGSWKSEAYAGTAIPTFREFIALCAQNGLHPYIELKSKGMTAQEIEKLVNILSDYGMYYSVTWISFYADNLKLVRAQCPTAELMYVADKANQTSIQTAQKLENGQNRVVLSALYSNLTAAQRAACLRAGLDYGIWTVNGTAAAVRQANTSAVFLTTDDVTAEMLY